MNTRAIRAIRGSNASAFHHFRKITPFNPHAQDQVSHSKKSTPFYSHSRYISMYERVLMRPGKDILPDLEHAISTVRKYDPSGYLPGLLIPSDTAKIGYFAIRSFWIESGLRFKEDTLKNSISASKQIPGLGNRDIPISDDERITMWREGVESLYEDVSVGNSSNDLGNRPGYLPRQAMPYSATLRLLKYVLGKRPLSKTHFDEILRGREIDVDMKQYPTVKSLEEHCEMSCGSLLKLVLECSGIHNDSTNEIIYDTAREIAIAHGLTNALRLSIPTASSTGKVIVPQELCEQYDIQSPRYLLSALGMGDKECRKNLQLAVCSIVSIARHRLEKARLQKNALESHPMGELAMSTFLPSVASETFLNRLEKHNFDLTDRTLRSVGFSEHLQCGMGLIRASIKKTY